MPKTPLLKVFQAVVSGGLKYWPARGSLHRYGTRKEHAMWLLAGTCALAEGILNSLVIRRLTRVEDPQAVELFAFVEKDTL